MWSQWFQRIRHTQYDSENFGNTVLEAMRRRVPVVVTPEVGAADIVRESGGGIVVAGDPEPLGGAICRLTTDLVA
jgi:glycosyltransferase involved in cell wall biosynthesis